MSRGDKAIKRLLFVLLLAAQSFAGTINGQIQTATGGAVTNGTLTFTLSQAAVLAGSGAVVTSTVACYTSNQGNVVGVPDPLVLPTVSTNTLSGTLPAGTYYVKFGYVGSSNSAPSPERTVTLTSTGTINVNAPALQPASATGYYIAIGATPGSETIQGTVTGWTQYQQSGALITGTTPPAVNVSIYRKIKILFVIG